jgi:geranylgeranyl diphosphate synthase type II
VYGDPKTFKKKLGGDIVDNKKTFMLINAYQRADETQKAELDRWIQTSNGSDEDKIAAVTHIYNILGIGELALQKIEELFAESLKSLDQVQVAEEKKTELRVFANKLLGRKY